MIKTENIYLRAFEPEDYIRLNELRNDDDIFEFTCGNKYYISSEWDRKWVEDKIFNNDKHIYLAICLKDNNKLLGYTSLNDIDNRNRKVQWGGIVIDKEYKSKGYATEVGAIILDFVFNELGLNRLYSSIIEENIASQRFTEKLGFSKEGVFKSSVFKKGKFHNEVLISFLKDDYNRIADIS